MSTCATVDTTSTISIMETSRDDTVEIPKRDSKGKKSKKQKKYHQDDDMVKEDTVLEETTTATIEQDLQQHERKSKKKKDKKRKRKDTVDDNNSSIITKEDDTSYNDDSHGSKKSKKKKKRRRLKEDDDNKQTQKEMDEKVVASSAIEYYPENLKSLQLKKNKEEKIATVSVENKDDNSEISSAAQDTKKKKKKSKKKSKHKDKVSNTDLKNNSDTKEHTLSKPNNDKDSKTSSKNDDNNNNITLLLFYQYVEPPWDEVQFQNALTFVTAQGNKHSITGRMRVAREGLNCTLTGSYDDIRNWCAALRQFDGGRSTIDPISGNKVTEFSNTEFKLTDDLPPKQRFPKLHAFEVVELVNYGLAGSRAPTIAQHGGTHLEPSDYHTKMCESDTVIIDVRNHYEANIGRFDPPKDGATMIDPKMRKSTEFPIWLDKNKEMLRGKQVLMYCTGGVR